MDPQGRTTTLECMIDEVSSLHLIDSDGKADVPT